MKLDLAGFEELDSSNPSLTPRILVFGSSASAMVVISFPSFLQPSGAADQRMTLIGLASADGFPLATRYLQAAVDLASSGSLEPVVFDNVALPANDPFVLLIGFGQPVRVVRRAVQIEGFGDDVLKDGAVVQSLAVPQVKPIGFAAYLAFTPFLPMIQAPGGGANLLQNAQGHFYAGSGGGQDTFFEQFSLESKNVPEGEDFFDTTLSETRDQVRSISGEPTAVLDPTDPTAYGNVLRHPLLLIYRQVQGQGSPTYVRTILRSY